MMKKIAFVSAAAMLSMSAATFADTLTLKNTNVADTIQVQCNGVPGLPILNNNQVGPLRFWLIKGTFQSKDNPLQCTFYNTAHPFAAPIGVATLMMDKGPKPTNAKIHVDSLADGFTATIDPISATVTLTPDITVSLSQN